ncbi:hypothetical protein MTP16_25735 (plasmid) [Hymenobacter monticola]|uniref:Uncharacterized protein n=1 Tax=Hymenobacter monticola TaxID=1705399 RepID=A0ABY4BJQ8_9BACT|nr:hypothetical protein [Hymenobacter monticola]UOE36835.1 hypothetical protein MTP16_25735 [Hymenobacter monticola]
MAKQGVPTEKMIQDLGKVVSHPQFQSIVQELEETPAPQRRSKAKQLASVDELKRRGIPVPSTMRFTTRMFENPTAPTTEFDLLDTFDPASERVSTLQQSELVAPTFCITVGVGELIYICASLGDTI